MRNSIKLFFIASLMSVPAFAATLLVPDDYPTIQEAVDAAEAGDIIMVGPGEYAGAVIDRVPVIIEGSGDDTRITMDNDFKFWPGEDAIGIFGREAWSGYCNDHTSDPTSWIPCGGDGTQIRDLMIDGSEGNFFFGIAFFGADEVQLEDITIVSTPYSVQGTDSDDASIENLNIVDSYQGVASISGNGWTIKDNMLVGVEMRPWQGAKQVAMILIVSQGNGHLIRDNTVYHVGVTPCTGEPLPDSYCGPDDDERYAGVALVAFNGPMGDNVVVDNRVTILVEGDGIDDQSEIVFQDYSLLSGGPPLVQGNSVFDNVLGGGCRLTFVPSELSDLNLVYDNKCGIKGKGKGNN